MKVTTTNSERPPDLNPTDDDFPLHRPFISEEGDVAIKCDVLNVTDEGKMYGVLQFLDGNSAMVYNLDEVYFDRWLYEGEQVILAE